MSRSIKAPAVDASRTPQSKAAHHPTADNPQDTTHKTDELLHQEAAEPPPPGSAAHQPQLLAEPPPPVHRPASTAAEPPASAAAILQLQQGPKSQDRQSSTIIHQLSTKEQIQCMAPAHIQPHLQRST
ncbi:hypothetical protein Nepgr_008071 [Nepenthes gracilis]|uniref:Uncharacterized protein n=1 Tax=Nepenthes gracilis TaxID=150966 RepID=A0AAD3S8X3_NEPGR|nr:hypothetical protein Nepgr_008071 [Nepenthes gracilis]